MKKLIPSFIKFIIWAFYLNLKYRRYNSIGRRVGLSKDFYCGKKCIIGNDVIIGRSVRLGNGVKIGKRSFLERVQIGNHSDIASGVVCTGYGDGSIIIGKESYIGINNIMDWSDYLTIGDYVHIAGPSTGLWTHTSAPMCINNIPLDQKCVKYRPTAPVTIESNVYIGGNCTIYPGVTVGHHSIVAPNSAVTKNVEPYTMVGGVPAKIIKKVDSPMWNYHYIQDIQ
jgi:acetyltransferase-like isoleucine patch superfamily enzyme